MKRILLIGIAMGLALSLVTAQDRRGRRGRGGDTGPKVGKEAPNFELKTIDGKNTVKLDDYKGEVPIALVFGSYT